MRRDESNINMFIYIAQSKIFLYPPTRQRGTNTLVPAPAETLVKMVTPNAGKAVTFGVPSRCLLVGAGVQHDEPTTLLCFGGLDYLHRMGILVPVPYLLCGGNWITSYLDGSKKIFQRRILVQICDHTSQPVVTHCDIVRLRSRCWSQYLLISFPYYHIPPMLPVSSRQCIFS